MADNRAKLFKKVLTVLNSVEAVKKSGYNSHQKYHYSTENDLLDAVRDSLVTNGVMVFTSSEYKGVERLSKKDKNGDDKVSLVTIIETTHTFADTETGEIFSVKSVGTGWDDTDKGAFKAITGAMKYFVSKNFMVATEDDPESDGVTTPKNNSPVKTFNKPAIKTVQVSGPNEQGQMTTTEVKTDQVVDTSQVEEKRAEPAPVKSTPIKFAKRTPTNGAAKTEPNF